MQKISYVCDKCKAEIPNDFMEALEDAGLDTKEDYCPVCYQRAVDEVFSGNAVVTPDKAKVIKQPKVDPMRKAEQELRELSQRNVGVSR